jgi:hypothetical protein
VDVAPGWRGKAANREPFRVTPSAVHPGCPPGSVTVISIVTEVGLPVLDIVIRPCCAETAAGAPPKLKTSKPVSSFERIHITLGATGENRYWKAMRGGVFSVL